MSEILTTSPKPWKASWNTWTHGKALDVEDADGRFVARVMRPSEVEEAREWFNQVNRIGALVVKA